MTSRSGAIRPVLGAASVMERVRSFSFTRYPVPYTSFVRGRLPAPPPLRPLPATLRGFHALQRMNRRLSEEQPARLPYLLA
jgi:hypothetical protein